MISILLVAVIALADIGLPHYCDVCPVDIDRHTDVTVQWLLVRRFGVKPGNKMRIAEHPEECV